MTTDICKQLAECESSTTDLQVVVALLVVEVFLTLAIVGIQRSFDNGPREMWKEWVGIHKIFGYVGAFLFILAWSVWAVGP